MTCNQFLKLTVIILIGFTTMSSTASAKEIAVTATNIEVNRGGDLLVFIFGKDGFPKNHDKALQVQTRQVDAGTMQFTFDIPDQYFAIKVLHDEDKNGKVTKNWTGIYPAEGLGFTNKQRVRAFGPPGWRKSHVTSAEVEEPLTIALRYPRNGKTKEREQ
jgi:uncharacterized protein (DUF2141 family)